MITLTQKLNVVSIGVPPIIHLSQYDSDFSLVFELYASTGNFTLPSGTTAEIRGTKADGNGYDADATVSGTTITVTGDEQMTAAAGCNVFEIALYKSGKRLNTINFILQVEHAALDADTITSESVLKELNAIIEGAATATQAAQDAEDAADRAEEAADDLSGTVQQVATNTQDIANLKDDLSDIIGDSGGGETTVEFIYGYGINIADNVAVGDTVDLVSGREAWYSLKYAIVNCREGDVFILDDMRGVANVRAWTFLTSDNVLISRSGKDETVSGNITAPANTAKAIIQGYYRLEPDDETTDFGTAYKIDREAFVNFTHGYGILIGDDVAIGDTVDLTNMEQWYSLKYAIVNCQEGDVFVLDDMRGAINSRAWSFLTSDNVLISRSASNEVVSGRITAPANAGKVVIQGIYREMPEDTTDFGVAYKIATSTGTGVVVRFDIVQNKTEEEKARARENIGLSAVQIETDTTLTQEGVAADAKTVGDVFASIGATTTEPLKTDIPLLFITGTLPTSKADGNVKVKVDYKSQTAQFSEYATLKVQGNSSAGDPKHNFTIKFYSDSNCTTKSKHTFMGWGNENKYVLKSNWRDVTQSRDVVTARLWTDIVRSRSDFASLPSALRTAPNYAVIDGFIIKVYANGVYQGRYTFNLPKDPYMFNMDENLETNCALYSENWDSGCYLSPAVVDGTDWTDEIHEDNPPQSVVTRLNSFITFLNNSTDASFVSDLHNYIDVQSFIDYYLFGLVDTGADSFGNNQILLSYDNCPYIASVYDLNCSWGLRYDGAYLFPTNYPFSEYYGIAAGNVLYLRLPSLFANSIRSRYEELRSGALSAANIIYRFEDFLRMQSKELVEEDYASTTANGAFVDMPSKDLTSLIQIRNYAAARLNYVDGIILT